MNLNHYAATPSDPSAGILGCGAHTDYGVLTFLHTDEVPGLQVRARMPRDARPCPSAAAPRWPFARRLGNAGAATRGQETPVRAALRCRTCASRTANARRRCYAQQRRRQRARETRPRATEPGPAAATPLARPRIAPASVGPWPWPGGRGPLPGGGGAGPAAG